MSCANDNECTDNSKKKTWNTFLTINYINFNGKDFVLLLWIDLEKGWRLNVRFFLILPRCNGHILESGLLVYTVIVIR